MIVLKEVRGFGCVVSSRDKFLTLHVSISLANISIFSSYSGKEKPHRDIGQIET
jgi:hypothetical protein